MTSSFHSRADLDEFTPVQYVNISDVFQTILESMPFTLGKKRDKLPYFFDGEITHLVTSSLQVLLELLRKRYAKDFKDPFVSSLPMARATVDSSLLDRRLCTRDLAVRPLARKITEDAILHNPTLDAGIVGGWFLHHKNTQRLLPAIRNLYLKGVAEDIKGEGSIKFAYLTHLCITAYLRRAKEMLKDIDIKGLSYERLDQAIGQILYSMLREVQAELFNEIRYRNLSYDVTTLEQLVKSATNPLIFTAIETNIFKSDLNPYHLDQEAFNVLQHLNHRLPLDPTNMEATLRDWIADARKNGAVRGVLIDLWNVQRFRDAVFHYLRDFEDSSGGTDHWLWYLFRSNKLIKASLAEDEAAKRLRQDLHRLVSEQSGPQQEERAARIETIDSLSKSYRRGPVFRRLFFRSRVDEQLREIISRFLLYEHDVLQNAAFKEILQHLEHRHDVKRTEELTQDYGKGHLYRFSTDGQPILHDRVVKKEAHLFLDLRGFTERMARSKEVAMADFMLKNFFVPALEVAKEFVTTRGIRLNNLLGDSLSFSGRIDALALLAERQRTIFDAYNRKLKEQRLSSHEGKQALVMKERFDREKMSIMRRRHVIDETIKTLEQELKAKESLNPFFLMKVQEEDFTEKLTRYQREIAALTKEIEREEDPSRRQVLINLRQDLHGLREEIREHLNELTETVGFFGHEELEDIFQLVCAEEQDALTDQRMLLKHTFDQEAELSRAYKKEVAGLWDDEVEYGLFISHGDASETITFKDDLWGKINVALADRLNEAARGAARNPEIRRRLESLLRSARKEAANPFLEYPFHVYIDRSYGISLPSDLGTAVDIALRGRDVDVALRAVDDVSSMLITDLQRGMKGIGEDGWDVLTPVNGIYNLGEAMSEEALKAYLKETSSKKFHFERLISVNELHPEIKSRFFFPDPELALVISVEKVDGQFLFDVFSYAGELIFKGFEHQKPTRIYEVIRKSSPFYRLLETHHLASWHLEAQQHTDQAGVA